MADLQRRFAEAGSIETFWRSYCEYLQELLNAIDPAAIADFAAELNAARQDEAVVFVAGNGGSAATATTMMNDLGSDLLRKTGITKPLRIQALTDNMSLVTAIANDVDYSEIFVSQLKMLYSAGDRLVVISASGNSPNVVRAAEWVSSRGGTVIALTGFPDGKLSQIADIEIRVPAAVGDYGPVEDGHLIVNHVLAHWLQNELRGE